MSNPISILLVDDHEDTNRSLMLLLKRRGYEVETALDMASALGLAGERAFDVLISDVTLPDGSGIDLLPQMKNRPPKYGGIIISGYGMDNDIARTKAAGYQAHLIKPVALQQLDETIQRLIRDAI